VVVHSIAWHARQKLLERLPLGARLEARFIVKTESQSGPIFSAIIRSIPSLRVQDFHQSFPHLGLVGWGLNKKRPSIAALLPHLESLFAQFVMKFTVELPLNSSRKLKAMQELF